MKQKNVTIGLLNLVAIKEVFENQMRDILTSSLFENYNINLVLLKIDSYTPRNSSEEYMNAKYTSWKDAKYDMLIITGAPLELVPYVNIKYLDELHEVFNKAIKEQLPTMFSCWSVNAFLRYRYNIDHQLTPHKLSGVFSHKIVNNSYVNYNLRDPIRAPVSKFTDIDKSLFTEDKFTIIMEYHDQLKDRVGIALDKNYPFFYMLSHFEYYKERLRNEYYVDINKGRNPVIPKHYFLDNDVNSEIIYNWQENCNQIFYNWVSHYF